MKKRTLISPHRFILATSALALVTTLPTHADVLDAFNFGTGTTSILTPTTIGEGVSATAITGDAGVTLDLANNQTGTLPASKPYLRIAPIGANPTVAAAVTANADFKFSFSALPGFTLNLTSLNFNVLKGGGGTRGYAVRSSVDNFLTNIATADVTTTRPDWTPVSIPLTTGYQNLSAATTFKIFSYSAAAGSSVEYDDIVVNGTAAFSGYAWQGTDGNWNTTSANWTGTGTIYAEGSNTWFGDAGVTTAVNVAAGGINPSLVTLTNSTAKNYTFAGGALNVATTLHKSGNGTTTFNNAVTAGSITADTGVLAVGPGGTLTSGNITVNQTGNLTVQAGGTLGATSALNVLGNAVFQNGAQSIDMLTGTSNGVTTLTGTALTVTGSSIYSGKITGTGSLVKTTGGSLELNGTSDFSGGITINGGDLRLSSIAAAGTGPVTVNPGGTLTVNAAVAAPITLAGGTIGAMGNAAPSGIVTATAATTTTVATYNPLTNATGSDVILTGALQGSGNLTISTINGNNPDNSAFRLRGPASNYSGTITVPESGKFELQTSVASGSPMGTGKLVLFGGAMTSTANGTYSIVNVRNQSTGDTNLGNDVQVMGTEATYLNLIGTAPAGSVTSFGNLEIGDGQKLAAVATNSLEYTVAFNSVTLTGGTASFIPQPVGNTSFNKPENIRLGTITQNQPGSGISLDGLATLTLTGTNTYTGPTSINSGTMVLTGSITGSTTSLNGGTLKGTGTAGNLTVNSGTLAPGNSPGILNTGNVDFNGGIFAIEIGGNQTGNGLDKYDQLNVTGTVSLNAPIELTLDFAGYDPVDGVDSFVIVNNDGTDAVTLAGSRMFYGVTELNEGTTFVATSGTFSQEFRVTYAGGSGNDIVLVAIPEPTAAAGMLVGLAALAGLRRRSCSNSR